MKKIFPAALTSTILLISLASCKKEIMYVGQHYNDLSPYHITSYSFTPVYQTSTDTLTFSYDWWGNPVKLTRQQSAVNPLDFEFRYDRSHRLTDYIAVYADGISTLFWHRYIYNPKGLITIDSVYWFSNIVNGQPTNPYTSWPIQLSYDSLQRVSREVNRNGYDDTSYFVYDAAGNLNGQGTYDDKVSFRRTNWVWMFLDRNYSINNPFTATSYNAGLLPLQVTLPAEGLNANAFLYSSFHQATFTYALDR